MSSSNKSVTQQAFLVTQTRQEKAYCRQKTEFDAKRRQEVTALCGSCKTCNHTRITKHNDLYCLKKYKIINPYNYCEFWKSKNELQPVLPTEI